MKVFLILCAIAAAVSALKQVNHQLSSQKLRIVIEKFGKPCAKGDNVDVNNLVARVADASLPRDDVTNEWLYCFAKSAGYVTEDGHILINGVLGVLGDNHPLTEEMKDSLMKCNEITKENPALTTVAMNDCIAETSPIRFVFS